MTRLDNKTLCKSKDRELWKVIFKANLWKHLFNFSKNTYPIVYKSLLWFLREWLGHNTKLPALKWCEHENQRELILYSSINWVSLSLSLCLRQGPCSFIKNKVTIILTHESWSLNTYDWDCIFLNIFWLGMIETVNSYQIMIIDKTVIT